MKFDAASPPSRTHVATSLGTRGRIEMRGRHRGEHDRQDGQQIPIQHRAAEHA